MDFCYPYGQLTHSRLYDLKNSGIIGGWFLTAGACNLIKTPPESARSVSTEKPGILIKVPDLDLFVEASSFETFRKFQRKSVFVDRNGDIVQLTK